MGLPANVRGETFHWSSSPACPEAFVPEKIEEKGENMADYLREFVWIRPGLRRSWRQESPSAASSARIKEGNGVRP